MTQGGKSLSDTECASAPAQRHKAGGRRKDGREKSKTTAKMEKQMKPLAEMVFISEIVLQSKIAKRAAERLPGTYDHFDRIEVWYSIPVYSSICDPSSTTRLGGILKKVVALRELCDMNWKILFRQAAMRRFLFETTSASLPRK